MVKIHYAPNAFQIIIKIRIRFFNSICFFNYLFHLFAFNAATAQAMAIR